MRSRSRIPICVAGAVLLGATMLAPALAKGPGDPEAPLTLRLLVWDHQGRQSEGAVNDLVRLASDASGGAITIVPTFDGGADTAAAVIAGTTDLAMLASREWDAAGVTSLDVLEAPFLIDNDALAKAVATGDIATDAMAGLGAVGVTGLAMWPEDLRHLFALNPSGRVFNAPADLAGADVLVVAGQPGHDLITTLGGRIYSADGPSGDLTGDRNVDAAAGTLEGMVTGLWGAGLPTDDVTVAGDLAIYAKEQVLVGNTAALAGLTDHQRQLLDQVVAETQAAALARQASEAELAQERCAVGGTVVAIGAPARAAFVAAAKPLADQLAAESVTGPLMARVQALKDQTPASPDAGTCEPASAGPSVAPDAGFIDDQPIPDGAYRITVTTEELRAAGADAEYAGLNAGTWTWTVAGGRWQATHDRRNEHCTGTVEVADGVVRFRDGPVDTGCGMGYEVRWRPVPEGIELRLAGLTAGGTDTQVRVERSLVDRVWTRLADVPLPSPSAPTGHGAPPAGIYRMSVTRDELRAAGATGEESALYTGTWTWTITPDGTFSWDLDNGRVTPELCHGTFAPAGDATRFTFVRTGQCQGYDDVAFTLSGDGVDADYRGCGGDTTVCAADQAMIERHWTRIGDAPAPG